MISRWARRGVSTTLATDYEPRRAKVRCTSSALETQRHSLKHYNFKAVSLCSTLLHSRVLGLRGAVGRLRPDAVAEDGTAAADLFEQRRVFDEGDAGAGLACARDEVGGDDDRVGLDVGDGAVLPADDRLDHLRVREDGHVLAVALDVLLLRG